MGLSPPAIRPGFHGIPLSFLCACGLQDARNDYLTHNQHPPNHTADSTTDPPEQSTSEGSTTGPGSPGSSDDATTDPESETTTAPGNSTGTDATASSTGPAAYCGDQHVDAGEECDDTLDPRCHNCYRDRRVFVTAPPDFNADLGSLAAADAECNYRAAKADLIHKFESPFKAWLSTPDESAAARMFHSPGHYVLTNAAADPFASSWDSLVTTGPINPPKYDEYGQEQTLAVWTGTLADGSVAGNYNNCDGWSDASVVGRATWGLSSGAGTRWTQWENPDTNPTDCLNAMAIYCFEQ